MDAYTQCLCITDKKMNVLLFQQLPLTQSSRITSMYQYESWICIHISSCYSILFTVDCVIQVKDERCIKCNHFFFHTVVSFLSLYL